jgi:hypothetical protein
VRLNPGARLGDVAEIEGEITLNLAETTETQRLDAPFAGQTIESAGVRIELKEAGEQRLSYSVSGETDRLLSVRAFNAQGQALATAGTAGGGSVGGFERKVERDKRWPRPAPPAADRSAASKERWNAISRAGSPAPSS